MQYNREIFIYFQIATLNDYDGFHGIYFVFFFNIQLN